MPSNEKFSLLRNILKTFGLSAEAIDDIVDRIADFLSEKEPKGVLMLSEEFEAEAVAYIVCSRLGINNRAADYLAIKAAKNDILPPISLEVIIHAVNDIKEMGKSLTPRAREIIADISQSTI